MCSDLTGSIAVSCSNDWGYHGVDVLALGLIHHSCVWRVRSGTGNIELTDIYARITRVFPEIFSKRNLTLGAAFFTPPGNLL